MKPCGTARLIGRASRNPAENPPIGEQSCEPAFFQAKCHKQPYGTVVHSVTVHLPSRREYFSALPLAGRSTRTMSSPCSWMTCVRTAEGAL